MESALVCICQPKCISGSSCSNAFKLEFLFHTSFWRAFLFILVDPSGNGHQLVIDPNYIPYFVHRRGNEDNANENARILFDHNHTNVQEEYSSQLGIIRLRKILCGSEGRGGGVALIESRHRWKSINSAQGTRRQRGKFKVYEVEGHVVKINDQSLSSSFNTWINRCLVSSRVVLHAWLMGEACLLL